MKKGVAKLIAMVVCAGVCQNIFAMEKSPAKFANLKISDGMDEKKNLTGQDVAAKFANLKVSDGLEILVDDGQTRPRKKSSPRPLILTNSKVSGTTPPNSDRSSSSSSMNSDRGHRSRNTSRSNSTNQELKTSPRNPQYVLWFCVPEHYAIIRATVGDVDRIALKMLEHELKIYNPSVLLFVESKDLNALEESSDYGTQALLEKLNITPDILHVCKDLPTLAEKVTKFYEIMEMYEGKVVAIYGINSTSVLYVMLARWYIPVMIEFAIKNSHNIEVSEQYCAIKDILCSGIGLKPLCAHILHLVYQTVLPHKEIRPGFYLSAEELNLVENFCLDELNKLSKKPTM